MNPVKIIDPRVPLKHALAEADGCQAKLGRMLNMTRAAVNRWVIDGRQNLPEEQAYRYLWHYGHKGEPPLKKILSEWRKSQQ